MLLALTEVIMNNKGIAAMSFGRARKAPETIAVELTSRCPLKCPQCYNDPAPREINRELLVGYLKEAAGLGVRCIALSGGEPLLYSDLDYIIELVGALGMTSVMATCGAGLSAKRIRGLKKAGLGHIAVSLNGSTQDIHEKSRDGYYYAISALNLLKESDMSYGINWVARKDNIDDFPNLVNLARQMKAETVTILRLKPDLKCHAADALDGEHLSKLGAFIKSCRSDDMIIYIEKCFSVLRTSTYGNKGLYNGCPAGRDFMAISADGDFLPCRHLFHAEKKSSIEGYWNNSSVLDRLRLTEENVEYPCRNCSHLPHCKTCRAACEKLYGSFYAGEKNCPVYQERGDLNV